MTGCQLMALGFLEMVLRVLILPDLPGHGADLQQKSGIQEAGGYAAFHHRQVMDAQPLGKGHGAPVGGVGISELVKDLYYCWRAD